MMPFPVSVASRQPDFLVGMDRGNPVLVPAGVGLAGPESLGDANTVLSASEVASVRALAAAPTVSLSSIYMVAKTNQTFSRTATNTAADNTFVALYSFVIPGGLMGPNGTLHWEAEVGFTDPAVNATNNGFQLRIGAVGICPEYSNSTAGQLFDNRGLEWHNTAVNAQKYRGSFVKQAGSTVGFTTTAIDTSVDQTVDFACRWSAATPNTDTLSLLSFRAWVEYGA